MARSAEHDADWGPTVGGGRRRSRPFRTLAIGLLVLLVLIALGALWANAQIPREPVDGLAASGRPMHVLVTGSDSREGLSRDERRDLTVGRPGGGERSDTIFVMTIDGERVALLAFPRDLWVTRCDGSSGRINVAVSIGGPSCLVATVRELSGIEVQHHVRVTFDGFRDVVDAVDGVELCLEDAIADRDAGIDLPAGCQRLDGTDALGFVRVRKIDNDLERIRRQQTFLRSLATEIASPSTLFNPFRMANLSREAGGAVTVDDDLGLWQLFKLARGARGLAGGTAVMETVPATAGTAGGASVLFVDEVAAQPLFAAFVDGSILEGAGDAAGRVDPSEIPVRVLNGAGVSGLAGQVAELLETRGYPIAEVGNTDARDRTVIQYPRSQRAAAESLAADVPGDVELERTEDVSHVTILLGSDAAARG